jgi:hypothetical protein
MHEPAVATRNRKRLRPNPVAPGRAVTVRAIGVKHRERVTIGGVEIDI